MGPARASTFAITLESHEIVHEDGELLVTVNVHADFPLATALIVTDIFEGEGRHAVVNRDLQVGDNRVTLHVPLSEYGTHEIFPRLIDTEERLIFEVPQRVLEVKPALECESATFTMEGSDLCVHAAVKRCSRNSPTDCCLVVRDTCPDGGNRVTVLDAPLSTTSPVSVVGLKAPWTLAGAHKLRFALAVRLADGVLYEFQALHPQRV